jgi:hypothetical protein
LAPRGREGQPPRFEARETAFDILLALKALKGEDSYGAGFWSGLFGGFLPQPPYFGGGQRRGFTFGLPAHRSLFGDEPVYDRSEEKAKREPYIPGLKRPRLYG